MGLRQGRSTSPCDCVLRSIFRICYERFREYASSESRITSVSLEIHSGPNRRGTWGRKEEEYVSDFLLIAKRTLTEEEYRLFRYHFLLGADFRLCIRKLGGDRGSFFNSVYRVQKKLGRVFAELEPYGLFPLSDYFYGAHRPEMVGATPVANTKVVPIRPPVQDQRKIA